MSINSEQTQINFLDALTPIYAQKNMSHQLKDDLPYLLDAYTHTEELWWDNINSLKKVKYVLLGEAPLYGDKKSYIYNPETKRTPFLEATHLNKIYEITGLGKYVSNKPEMLRMMREIGLVVVDLFPFAFNNNTAIQHGKLSQTLRIILGKSCVSWHLDPKLKKILSIAGEKIIYGVRYTRLLDTAQILTNGREELKSGNATLELASRKVANAPLDVDRMARYFAE